MASTKREDWFRPGAAVHLFFLRGEELLMARRHNTGYEDGKLSVVAGKLDGGEQVVQAAIREAREEAGVELQPEQVEIVGIMHRMSGSGEWVDFFVTVRDWPGEPVNCEPHKCSEFRWVRTTDLPADTIPYIRRAVDNYVQGRWFDSFGWT